MPEISEAAKKAAIECDKVAAELGLVHIATLSRFYDIIQQAIDEATAEIEMDIAMADGCLSEVKEGLEALGVDMSATPPMFYKEAIIVLVMRLRKVLKLSRNTITEMEGKIISGKPGFSCDVIDEIDKALTYINGGNKG